MIPDDLNNRDEACDDMRRSIAQNRYLAIGAIRLSVDHAHPQECPDDGIRGESPNGGRRECLAELIIHRHECRGNVELPAAKVR